MRRTILSALALIIAFAFAAEAKAAQQQISVAGTAWVSTTKVNGMELPVGIGFRANGTFFLAIQVDGKFEMSEGTYEVVGSLVKVKLNGQDMDLNILAQDDNTLVTHGGNDGRKIWVRARG